MLPTYFPNIPYYNARQTFCKSNAAQMTIQQFFFVCHSLKYIPVFYGFKKKQKTCSGDCLSLRTPFALHVAHLITKIQHPSFHLNLFSLTWTPFNLQWHRNVNFLLSGAPNWFVPPKNRGLEVADKFGIDSCLVHVDCFQLQYSRSECKTLKVHYPLNPPSPPPSIFFYSFFTDKAKVPTKFCNSLYRIQFNVLYHWNFGWSVGSMYQNKTSHTRSLVLCVTDGVHFILQTIHIR